MDVADNERRTALIPETLASGMNDVARGHLGVGPSIVTHADVGRDASRRPHDLTLSRNPGDIVLRALTGSAAVLILAVSALMFIVLIVQSRQSISHFGLGFLISSAWDPSSNNFGALPAITGTIYTSLLAILVAGPLGILVAVFLAEMAPLHLRLPLGFLVELLAAVPSVVYGLWALFVLVPLVAQYVAPSASQHLGGIFLFSNTSPTGLGVFTAVLILSIMILPTIAAISRDVILAVPRAQREAMLALGATRWETTWKVILPYARSGIIGGVILALGRAVGETMAVQMVIGNSQSTGWSLLNFATTMPANIVNQFTEATPGLYQGAILELALILLVIAVGLNAVARLLVWSVNRKYSA